MISIIVAFLVLLQRYEICNMCYLWLGFRGNLNTAKEGRILLDILNGLDRGLLRLLAQVSLMSSFATIKARPVRQFHLGLSAFGRSVAFPTTVGAGNIPAPPWVVAPRCGPPDHRSGTVAEPEAAVSHLVPVVA